MLKKFLHHVERTLPSYFQWRFESAIGTVGRSHAFRRVDGVCSEHVWPVCAAC